MLVWKKGVAVLTAGNVKVTPDPRISLVNGNNLQILDLTPQDAGVYTCQIGTLIPKELSHTLEVLGKKYCVVYFNPTIIPSFFRLLLSGKR